VAYPDTLHVEWDPIRWDALVVGRLKNVVCAVSIGESFPKLQDGFFKHFREEYLVR
jgi:hypothetical protein